MLTNTAWVLAWLPGHGVISDGPAIRFDAGRVTGSAGCDRFTATYVSSGSTLQIGPRAASTQMACPDPVAAQATMCANAMTKTRTYGMEADIPAEHRRRRGTLQKGGAGRLQ